MSPKFFPGTLHVRAATAEPQKRRGCNPSFGVCNEILDPVLEIFLALFIPKSPDQPSANAK